MATIIKRKNSFLAQVRIAGFNPRGKTFPTRSDAKAWADEVERTLRGEAAAKGTRPDLATLTLAGLIREFLADPETQKLRYYDDLHRMLCWWLDGYGTVRVIDCGVLVLREARGKLAKDRGPATVNRYLSALRSAWNWGRATGLVQKSNVWPPRLMLTEPEGRTRFLADAEIVAVLKAAKAHSPVMAAAVTVSLGTGLRRGELLRLDWSDVDFGRAMLRIRLTKTDKPRQVHVGESAAETLRALKRQKIVAAHVFCGPRGARLTKDELNTRWQTVRSRAGIADVHWHDLRHTAASVLAQSGATLLEIGRVLGHSSPSVTQRYAHLVEGQPIAAHAELDKKLRT